MEGNSLTLQDMNGWSCLHWLVINPSVTVDLLSTLVEEYGCPANLLTRQQHLPVLSVYLEFVHLPRPEIIEFLFELNDLS